MTDKIAVTILVSETLAGVLPEILAIERHKEDGTPLPDGFKMAFLEAEATRIVDLMIAEGRELRFGRDTAITITADTLIEEAKLRLIEITIDALKEQSG